MVADESERDDADGLEDAIVDEKAALKLTAEGRWLLRSLRKDCEDDD